MILILCGVLAVGSLLYVFWVRDAEDDGQSMTRLARLREQKDVVYENLRDLNFEFKAGKLPEKDYYEMRDSLEQEAANLLAQIDEMEVKEGARV
jgi:hypothetical protein